MHAKTSTPLNSRLTFVRYLKYLHFTFLHEKMTMSSLLKKPLNLNASMTWIRCCFNFQECQEGSIDTSKISFLKNYPFKSNSNAMLLKLPVMIHYYLFLNLLFCRDLLAGEFLGRLLYLAQQFISFSNFLQQ